MATSHRRLTSSELRARTAYDLRLVPLPVDVARWMLGDELHHEPETLLPEPETSRHEPETSRHDLVEGQPQWHPEYPLPDSLDAIAMGLAAHEAMRDALDDPPAWWIYQIVIDNVVVGDIGFHGPPGPQRTVEIGYSVVPAWRGRGVASRACELILQRAWRDGAEMVVAETDHDNVASQGVLLSNGFRRGSDGVFVIKRPEAR